MLLLIIMFDLLLLLSVALPVPGFGGHGVPDVTILRWYYHCSLCYFRPITEALCINNYLSSTSTPSFVSVAFAEVFYFFIPSIMLKEAHLSARAVIIIRFLVVGILFKSSSFCALRRR